jgi:two-component system alkaline phosphatase synthesis response regulator PhoP
MSDNSNTPSGEQSPILLVVDSNGIAESIIAPFQARGWSVYHSKNGSEAREHLISIKPTLVVLDLNLSDMSGLQLLAEIVRDGGGPPVITTSESDEGFLSGASFRLGAVDYVRQPFSITEFLERALARTRTGLYRRGELQQGDVFVDEARRLLCISGDAVPLPPKTFDILVYLIRKVGRVVSERELVGLITHTTATLRTRRVSYHIAFLRRIFRENNVTNRIRTVRSHGYEWMD